MGVTHSQLFPDRPSLLELIRHAIDSKSRWVEKRELGYLGFAYRLDFETSGIALFCKTNEARQQIGDLIGANKERREFFCLVHGTPDEDVFTIDAKIGWVAANELMKAGKRGKFAQTKFEVIERFAGITLLRCLPGRTGNTDPCAPSIRRVATCWGCLLRRKFIDAFPAEEKLSTAP